MYSFIQVASGPASPHTVPFISCPLLQALRVLNIRKMHDSSYIVLTTSIIAPNIQNVCIGQNTTHQMPVNSIDVSFSELSTSTSHIYHG